MTKQHFYTLGALVALLAAVGSVSYLMPQMETQSGCLKEGEVARVENDKPGYVGDLRVVVENKRDGMANRTFVISDAPLKQSHVADVRKCAVYSQRVFGIDHKSYKPLSNYSNEIWRYGYGGEGRRLLQLAGKDEQGLDAGYSLRFLIDPNEKYLPLQQGYLGSSDGTYNLVVKDLNTLEDAFVLPMQDVFDQNKNLTGDMEFYQWSDDSRYFWFRTYMGAYTFGYVRIDTTNWSYDVYDTPEGVLGGYQLNINNGWIYFVPGAFWAGADIFEEAERAEREKIGHTADLYLYNLFTKETLLVEDTKEPVWNIINGEWPTDTTFQYTMPDEKTVKTYELPR